jgi:CubicO group peptidase (beta-lactamase class C family)
MRAQHRGLLAAWWTCVVLLPPGLLAQTTEAEFNRQVEAILDHWGAPGAVVAIVKDGDPLLVQGYGATRVAGGGRATPNTLNSVASVTKAFNSIVMAMLVAEGKVAWDDPVKKHIPEFEFADSYRTEHTTLRDVITHRAGLPSSLGALTSMTYTMEQMLEALQTAPPRIAFRERIDYSQVGIALFGEVVRRTTDESWSAYLDRRILEPLGMRSTFAGTNAFLEAYPSPGDVAHVMGRAVRADGQISDGTWRGVGTVYTPAGGIVTSADDMARFLAFVLNPRASAVTGIDDDVLHELFTPQEIDRGPYSSVINPLSGLVAYGLGWFAHEYAGSMIMEHPGSNFGSSVVAVLPGRGIGVFLSSGATYSLDSDRMVSALKFASIDYALGAPPRDWITLLGAR